ncbi:MFS transporter [Nonomuraea longicatena]|uniref:MFS transporter n=1 Tax=Nonomuraea longicatena TaxID=83682 RepID=A0ABN1Q325_9ACTN
MNATVSRARVAVFCVFWLSGLVCALWSAALPAINDRLQLGEIRLGAVLLVVGLGTLTVMPVGGRLCDRFSSRRVLGVAGTLAALTLLGPAFAPSFPLMLAAAFVLGGGLGLLDVAMNAHAIEVEALYGRPVMSGFHGVWSLGGVAGGAAVAGGLHAGVDIGWVMASGALVAAVLFLFPRRALLPDGVRAQAAAPEAAGGGRPMRFHLVLLLGLVAFCAFVSEGAAADWAGLHASTVLGVSTALAPVAYTVFSATMTLVRLLGDGLRARLGPERTLRWAGLTALAGFCLVLVVSWVPGMGLPVRTALAYTGWALAGLGLATVVPVVFSAIGAHHGSDGGAGRMLSWVSMFGYVGLLSGPALIGPLAELTSLGTAMLLPAALCVVIVGLGPVVLARAAGRTGEKARVAP